MKKLTKFIATATAALLTFGFAGCQKNSSGNVTYPNFINPTEIIGGGDEQSEKYVVNVLSEGGLKLNNVKVTARKDNLVKRGISEDGKIEFSMALGEYTLEIDPDSLPQGYYLPTGVTYKTNPDKRDEVTIRIPSKPIDASAAVDSYAVGSIMRDFTFTDCYGKGYTLSEMLKTKKAVVLNFFFTGCPPCRSEFPAIQKAYQNRINNDVEVIAMSTTQNGDNDSTVATFKESNNITFPMGIDRIGLTQIFQNGFPTTVIIDRYGLIAYRTFGGEPATQFWANKFETYAAENYVQNVSGANGGNSGGGNGGGTELVKPDVEMPSSIDMKNAAVDSSLAASEVVFTNDENEFSWPWQVESTLDGGYIYSSNKGIGNSFSIVHISIDLKKDQVLSFDYKVSSEDGCDLLYVFLDGDPMNTGGWSGDHKDSWQSVNLYVADYDKTVDLAFAYEKDEADRDDGSSGDDVAKIRNIRAENKSILDGSESLDVIRNCATGGNDGYEYEHYVDYEYYDPNLYANGDGFYHIVERADPAEATEETPNPEYKYYVKVEDKFVLTGTDGDGHPAAFEEGTTYYTYGAAGKGAVKNWGPIIYMSLSQITPWSDLHTGSTLTGANGTRYQTTLFKMTEEQYVNTEGEVTVVIGNADVTEAYTVYVLIMPYMDAPFYPIPVTPLLKSWADAFIAAYEKGKQHDNEWLEFCYYYDHYGAEHDDKELGDGKACKVHEDYTKGLTTMNAYTAYEKSELATMANNPATADELKNSPTYNAETGRNVARINFPLQLTHNGTYYKFKANTTGVYNIRAYTRGCSPDGKDPNSEYASAAPAFQITDKNGNPRMMSGEPADLDALKDLDLGGVEYDGFNEYIELDKDEEIFLYLETTQATRSYYDFEIKYLGETFQKIMVCSPGGGMWVPMTGSNGQTIWIYPAISTRYDDVTDRYYALNHGSIDYDQPVYISMLYASYLRCEIPKYAYASVGDLVEDNAFENYIHHGEEYQTVMEKYLGDSTKDKQPTDPDYGLIPANKEIVEILNMFITENVDNVPGQTTGWLMFGVYNAKFGN